MFFIHFQTLLIKLINSSFGTNVYAKIFLLLAFPSWTKFTSTQNALVIDQWVLPWRSIYTWFLSSVTFQPAATIIASIWSWSCIICFWDRIVVVVVAVVVVIDSLSNGRCFCSDVICSIYYWTNRWILGTRKHHTRLSCFCLVNNTCWEWTIFMSQRSEIDNTKWTNAGSCSNLLVLNNMHIHVTKIRDR